MALWTPADITTALWIDFADQSTLFDATSGGSVVTNGVGIARAEDKSGNGRNFTEGSSGNRPTWTSGVQNGLGIARYDGDDRLTSVAAASTWTFLHSSQSTIFCVIKTGTTNNPSAFYSWFGNNAGSSANRGVFFGYDNRNILTGMTNSFSTGCFIGTTGSQVYSQLNSAGTAIVTEFRNVLSANTFQFHSLLSDPANATPASRIKLGVNGGILVGNNERNVSPSSASPTFDLQIGALGNNSSQTLGDFCELIIAPSLLSTADRQNTEGYLAHKWGLTASLPSDHPYKNAAPVKTLKTGLISYWKLDEANGNAIDAHGSNTLGTVGSPGTAAGKIGNARTVSVNNYFSVASNSSLVTGDIDFYISLWYFPTSNPGGNNAGLLSKWEASTNNRQYLVAHLSTRLVRFVVSSNGTAAGFATATTFGALSLNQWHFVEAWHNSASDQLGVAVNTIENTASYTDGVLAGGGAFNLGSFNNDGNVAAVGRIDEVGFWKRVLTSSERTALWSGGNGLAYDNFAPTIFPRRRREMITFGRGSM